MRVQEYHIDGFRFDLASILTRAPSAWYPSDWSLEDPDTSPLLTDPEPSEVDASSSADDSSSSGRFARMVASTELSEESLFGIDEATDLSSDLTSDFEEESDEDLDEGGVVSSAVLSAGTPRAHRRRTPVVTSAATGSRCHESHNRWQELRANRLPGILQYTDR